MRIWGTSSMTGRSLPGLRYCMNSASLKFVKQGVETVRDMLSRRLQGLTEIRV